MSIAEPQSPASEPTPVPTPQPYRRPIGKRVMHVVRRAHLYFGLFLLPWAVLYGATGFLFNHPLAFSDQPTTSFGTPELAGTPMEATPEPAAVAEQVVSALNERATDGAKYKLVEPAKAKYLREFAFATVKAGDTEVSLLFDVNRPSGTVRSKAAPAVAPKVEEKAPFAISGAPAKAAPTAKGPVRHQHHAPKADPSAHNHSTGLAFADPLHERVKAATPVVLERTGYPGGDVTVTSVPDLSFLMSDGAKTWTVTYNALTGAVAGASAEGGPPPDEMSTRRFLTRLHLAHGYPGSQNAKWFWAIIVDAMAFVMVFWGVSGIFMWWQLKATRGLGLVVLLLSAAAATALALGMHEFLSPK